MHVAPSGADLTDLSRMTKLPNGVRVASVDFPGHFVSAAAFVDAGTRHQLPEEAGVCHALDQMAFKSTRSRDAEAIGAQIAAMGSNIGANTSRESTLFQAAVFHKDLPTLVQLFGDCIRNPLFRDDELAEVKENMAWELNEMQFRPDVMLPEMLHQVAYAPPPSSSAAGMATPQGLAQSLLCHPEAVAAITPEMLHAFRARWYRPEQMVLAGVGMPHEQLVEQALAAFGDLPAATTPLPSLPPTQYHGGYHYVNAHALPKNPNPEVMPLTHVYIGFEAPSLNDPDIFAVATLASLMGGGGSFSAGGPGKGMYTRLFTEVMNRHHWIENCHVVQFSYADSGIFGISAAVPPSRETHASILPVLCDQLVNMTTRIGPDELHRAKNQLKSNILMSLESKLVEVEDLGRQIMAHGRRMSATQIGENIDALTAEDLKRVASRIVFGDQRPSPILIPGGWTTPWTPTGNGGPTVVAQGYFEENDLMLQSDRLLAQFDLKPQR
ncbi:hypothetical protein CXG81DRAFT_11623 [Caulochytrium protostelioides]|uniref:LuxS/MPP-like metallohydrolase n=1 Tax=Caulochytrium protostelioides TaxID=1555241 RepID=A0A4P9X8Z5_9FUNG|nr:hypothetical protein CXG81DRAFT_11623 [Caulochytrium protostelioides]|eukprot:RKP01748.1 hypothetical protein CXG81DRAFT_11623 [Caulochytrium protostelioides]